MQAFIIAAVLFVLFGAITAELIREHIEDTFVHKFFDACRKRLKRTKAAKLKKSSI